MSGQIREGDILLVPVDLLPPESATHTSRVVLAEGEVIGHLHIVEASVILDWSVEGQRYIRVLGAQPGALSHPQHDPAPAPVVQPDVTYKVVRQQTLNLQDEWREVQD